MLSFYLTLVLEEDRDTVREIYLNYYKHMVNHVYEITRDDISVEDIVHDCMLKIIMNISKIDTSDKGKLKYFCGIVARHCALDHVRKNSDRDFPEEELIEAMADNDPLPEELFLSKEALDTIVKAIDSMNDNYRSVCQLKYIFGYKEREIADILGIPPKTVNIRIFRGRRILREALKEIYE